MRMRPVRIVLMSEDAVERLAVTRLLNGLPGVELVGEVNLICQMGRQAGHVEADCVVLDIDRFPIAGVLSLGQARATFPDARIIVLARSIQPRFLRFLRESGASCCVEKDDPDRQVQLTNALRAIVAAGAGLPPRVSAAEQHGFTRPLMVEGVEPPAWSRVPGCD